MAAPVAPLVLAASALGFGLWWFWPAQKTGSAIAPTGGGGATPAKTPTAEQTAAAKAKGALDGCARGTSDAKAGKSPAQAAADLNVGGKDHAALLAAEVASGDPDAYYAAYSTAHKACFDAVPPTRSTTTYKVLPGDDPAKVAKKFGVSVADLVAANDGMSWGSTGQEVVAFDNSVRGSVIPGTSEGQIDASGPLNVVSIFTPTMGIVSAGGLDGYPVYDSNIRVKGAGNNSVYFPKGKAGQPYAAGGPNPAGGRAYYDPDDKKWGWVMPWKSGDVINVPAAASAGTGALVRSASAGAAVERRAPQYATGPRIGNTAIVGARRAPVEVDQMHAGMARHFSPSSRMGWPAPPDEVDDGASTLYRSY